MTTDSTSACAPLRLRTVPDLVLRVITSPVLVFDDALARTAAQMLEMMYSAGGVGLAANQAGLTMSMFVIDTGDGPDVVVNPLIVERHGVQSGFEGCLSIPDRREFLPRPGHVVLAGRDLEGLPVRWEMSGLAARCACHEVDHLNGTLYTDHLLGTRT